MARITERAIFSIAALPLLFGLINLDPQMTIIFISLLFFGYHMFHMDTNVTYKFEGDPSQRYVDIALGVGATFLFYFVAAAVLPIFEKIMKLSHSTETIQSLYSNNILFSNYITSAVGGALFVIVFWMWIIPIVENIFLIRTFEGITDVYGNIMPNLKSIALWGAIISVSAGIALFHLKAKGAEIAATSSLFVTLLFFAMVIALTVWRKSMIAGVAAHITANGMALKSSLAVLTTTAISTNVAIAIGIGVFVLALRTEALQNTLSRVGIR